MKKQFLILLPQKTLEKPPFPITFMNSKSSKVSYYGEITKFGSEKTGEKLEFALVILPSRYFSGGSILNQSK